METSIDFAQTAMLIRKPVSEVYEALVDSKTITKFWFTHSSGHLEEGASVLWTWEMYNVSVDVKVVSLVPNERIEICWGDDPDVRIIWTFEVLEDLGTFLKVKNTGFKGAKDELIAKISDATEGFTLVLAGLKAYLEHGIELNLVADRYPKK